MKKRFVTPTMRMVAIGLTLLAVVVWLQLQHLTLADHEHALIALVGVGYLAFWMAQGHRR